MYSEINTAICVICIAFTVVVSVLFAIHIVFSFIERKRLTELLAAKDYTNYKSFESSKKENKEHSNMFTGMEKREKGVM